MRNPTEDSGRQLEARGSQACAPPTAMGHRLRASLISSPLWVLVEHVLGPEEAQGRCWELAVSLLNGVREVVPG